MLSSPALVAAREEHAALEARMADPAVHADRAAAADLGRRYAALGELLGAADALHRAEDDLGAARELAALDDGFAAEVPVLHRQRDAAESALRAALRPPDPLDASDVLVEVKAGEGGEESALFAGDLVRLYLRYAERRGWVAEVLDGTPTDLGGWRDAVLSVRARRRGDGQGPWSRLKWEGGVHRVQRVPTTESAGRVHTSAAGVVVLPETQDREVVVDPGDLRVDTFRSSGPGGQSVNTTDSAVRVTHLPTGTVVSCQNEKSQLQNRESAMRILRARLVAAAREEAAAAQAAQRAGQVSSVDRSERIRTYNFPQRRVTDHRVGYTAHRLEAVLDGDLDAVVDAVADGLGGDGVSAAEPAPA